MEYPNFFGKKTLISHSSLLILFDDTIDERHTGTGLPGLEPETLEEQIVCYADKFYSKSSPDRVRTVAEAAQSLEKFGEPGVRKFLEWAARFE